MDKHKTRAWLCDADILALDNNFYFKRRGNKRKNFRDWERIQRIFESENSYLKLVDPRISLTDIDF